MSRLRQIPVSSSLNRPILLLGAERKPVIIVMVLTGLLILSDISVFKLVLAFVFWVIAMGLLRLMAKADPHLIQIYVRRLKYKTFYPACSRAIK
jgi:type IV secretory pathway TrbD component